jgi:hypothetical protein
MRNSLIAFQEIFDSPMPERYSRRKRTKRWSTAAVPFRWSML